MTATFPEAPLGLEVDIDLAGTWTNISSSVYQREGDDPPLLVTRGRPDESSQVNSGTMTCQLNNAGGQFTVRNAEGPYFGLLTRNAPVRVSVPATSTTLRMENDQASYVSAPPTTGLSITGDIQVELDLQLSSYMPTLLASKWNSGSNLRSWAILLNPNGTVGFAWSSGGTDAVLAATSSVPVPLGRIALQVTLQVSTATVTFSTAPAIAGPWTQLGSAWTDAAATSVFGGGTSSAPVIIGYNPNFAEGWFSNGTPPPGLNGNVYAFSLASGIASIEASTTEASPAFTAQTPGATSFADAQGNTWTLNGTAEISARDYRFHGEMSSLPVTWDSSGTDVWVPVTAGGLLRRLGQGDAPIYSPIKRAILLTLTGTLAPVAYWACEDLAGSTAIGSGIGGPQMQVFGGPPTFATDSSFICSSPLPQLDGSSWYGPVPHYTSSGSLIVRFLLNMATAPANGTKLMQVITTGTCTELSLYYAGATGGYGLVGNNASGAVFNTGGVNFAPSIGNGPVWASIELQPGSGSTVNYAMVFLEPGATTAESYSGTFTGSIGNAAGIWVNPSGGAGAVAVGHVTVQSAWESLFALGSPLDAWQGETAANRFYRLAGENGYQARIYGPPGSSALMGAQTPQTLTDLLQECETADMGLIYEPRKALALGYRPQAGLYNQSYQQAVTTITYSAHQLGGTDTATLEPTYDDQYTRNDYTIERGSGTTTGGSYRAYLNDGSPMSITPPPAGVGDYSDSLTVNIAADTQLPDTAWWLVHTGTVDDYRWPAVPVNMARTEVAGILAAVQGCEIGDFIVIAGPPGWLPPDPIKQLIFGVTEGLGGYHYQITWACAPESPYETGLFDDPVYGRADTDGSTLSAGVSATATALQVATTSSATPVWTTAASDFPFNIQVAGEEMTVTSITGTTSPQTFTVTRSVNGVVKAQAAGTDVRLYIPPVYAMF